MKNIEKTEKKAVKALESAKRGVCEVNGHIEGVMVGKKRVKGCLESRRMFELERDACLVLDERFEKVRLVGSGRRVNKGVTCGRDMLGGRQFLKSKK